MEHDLSSTHTLLIKLIQHHVAVKLGEISIPGMVRHLGSIQHGYETKTLQNTCMVEICPWEFRIHGLEKWKIINFESENGPYKREKGPKSEIFNKIKRKNEK